MPNFRNLTAAEILVQMPEARSVLVKHFGTDWLPTGSGASLRELARYREVDLRAVVKDLKAMARSTGMIH